MEIVARRVLGGPNLHATWPVVCLEVDLGPFEHRPTDTLPGFTDRLLEALPTLRTHHCSEGVDGGFVRRLRRGTWLGHVLEHVAIELQGLVGDRVSFGRTRGTGTEGVYTVVYSFLDPDVGLAAGDAAHRILLGLLPPELRGDHPPADVDGERARLDDLARRRRLGPSTAALVRAAEARGIPWERLDDDSLLRLGYGRFQRMIRGTLTGNGSVIAVETASDKALTARLLADVGLPVPTQRLVADADEAARAAREIGGPVVVKPLDANHGRGVSTALTTDDEVRRAFAEARAHGPDVLVESFVAGDDHRLLVVDGRLVAAARRTPAHVVGDGVHTVRQLVALVNADPRRGEDHEQLLTRIALDAHAERILARQGLEPDAVPEVGRPVALRATANLSSGGTAVDVTDLVHPDTRELAELAVRTVGLDVGGVDLLTPDVTRSWREVGGAICEVNAAPGLRMHLAPTEGRPRDVAGPIVDSLFPPGARSAPPILALTGTNGKTTTARMLAHLHATAGARVGLATTDGVYVGDRLRMPGDLTGPVGARAVLSDPTVEVAVLEVARGGLLRDGLGVPWCDVGAVLNVGSDHLGLRGVDTLEQLAYVKRIVVDVARDTAVLSADCPYTLEMAAHTPARRVCLVGARPDHPRVRAHLAEGGCAALLEPLAGGDTLVLYDHGAPVPLVRADAIPATLDGVVRHNAVNALFAAAMAWASGLPPDVLRDGLRTFDTGFDRAPGRLNVFPGLPFRVVVDYAHNPPAFAAMADVARRLGQRGARICVAAAPGDRRDVDIEASAHALAPGFDQFVLRDERDRRGRAPGEIPAVFARGLARAGVGPDRIARVDAEEDAVCAALDRARPGDLVVVFAERPADVWATIGAWADRQTVGSAVGAPGRSVQGRRRREEGFDAG